MRYFANPSTPAVREAMQAGLIDCIETPRQGNAPVEGATWCADNGCFTDVWSEDAWWQFLENNAERAESCMFAVAPDVVGEAWPTQMRAMSWLAKIRELGYPAAYVAQDGARTDRIPWEHFDVLFLGGSTEWKLGWEAAALTYIAKRWGKKVHMGRVNSFKRLDYAKRIGCDSADGTYIAFGPDQNLPKVLRWVDELAAQRTLFDLTA